MGVYLLTNEDKVELEEKIGAKLTLPETEDGTSILGEIGQFAVSDGAGGLMWLTLTNVAEVGA